MKRGKVIVEDTLGPSSNKLDKLVSIYLSESVLLAWLSDGLIWPIHSAAL